VPKPLEVQGNTRTPRPQQHPRQKIPRQLVTQTTEPHTRMTTVMPVPTNSRENKARILEILKAQRPHVRHHLIHEVRRIHHIPRKFQNKTLHAIIPRKTQELSPNFVQKHKAQPYTRNKPTQNEPNPKICVKAQHPKNSKHHSTQHHDTQQQSQCQHNQEETQSSPQHPSPHKHSQK
jgi:hypothetical protein